MSNKIALGFMYCAIACIISLAVIHNMRSNESTITSKGNSLEFTDVGAVRGQYGTTAINEFTSPSGALCIVARTIESVTMQCDFSNKGNLK